MSRAFIKEDDGERSNAVSKIQYRENKVEWLRIQEKKLDLLLNNTKSKKINSKTLSRWIDEITADIEKTKKKLEY